MANMSGGNWNNPDYGFDPQGVLSGVGGLLGGLFGNSGKPYDEAQKQYKEWADKAQGINQPYMDAGKEGIKDYQDWINKQKNPTEFINGLMGDYQESPYAHYLQQAAMNAGNNSASAGGLIGSSALMQQQQQNAANVTNQDMNQWLQSVLGINTQYGQGQKNLIDTGQNSTNSLTNMYNNMGTKMGEAAYGKEAGKQQDFWNTIGGGLGILGSFL